MSKRPESLNIFETKNRMTTKRYFFILIFILISNAIFSQTKQDSIEIRQSAIDYIESQHKPNPAQMEHALHPRMVKRTFWKDKATGKDYIRETTTESMVLLAESYNKNNDKFPPSPKKEVKLLDVSERTASVKLIADQWIDYLHIVKLNGSWKIINVLWQFKDTSQH
ncbi:nuclear transport factor 2 family protein [Pedobacter mendelii]|uniref:Lumazine-binding protein n=1 Tax=Pedobacter mendelii TaxID=1908240 RepID=A0ABQ2BFM6_9SPHI|nr:nuclear transport factor 2 family protein [Pedobacter mendelii]GGI23776.1 hypothetical protein GCM10008119_09350 [Pedobacter mendelii]